MAPTEDSKWRRRPKTDKQEIKDDELEEYQIEDIREEIERLDIEKKNFENQKRLSFEEQDRLEGDRLENERKLLEQRLKSEREEFIKKTGGRIATNGSLGSYVIFFFLSKSTTYDSTVSSCYQNILS